MGKRTKDCPRCNESPKLQPFPDEATQAFINGRELGREEAAKPLEGVREPFNTMTRAQLVDEIDRYARNYNALERSRDAYKWENRALQAVAEAAKSLLFSTRAEVGALSKALKDLDAFYAAESDEGGQDE